MPEQKPQKSQKSAIDSILKKESAKKEEPVKEIKQADTKVEEVQPQKKEPAIIPTVKTKPVVKESPTKLAPKIEEAPHKKEAATGSNKEADVREVPDLFGGHNVLFGVGANQGNEFVLNDDKKGEDDL